MSRAAFALFSPLQVGDRVSWERHHGEVVELHDGSAVVRNDSDGRRWRVALAELRRA